MRGKGGDSIWSIETMRLLSLIPPAKMVHEAMIVNEEWERLTSMIGKSVKIRSKISSNDCCVNLTYIWALLMVSNEIYTCAHPSAWLWHLAGPSLAAAPVWSFAISLPPFPTSILCCKRMSLNGWLHGTNLSHIEWSNTVGWRREARGEEYKLTKKKKK